MLGLSGSGKTTTAMALAALIRPFLPNVFVLDGDMVRIAYGDSLGHSAAEREVQLSRLQRFAGALEQQSIITIASSVYCTPEFLASNRTRFAPYYEIYLQASLDFLVKNRDGKGLYSGARTGTCRDVVGVDIPWCPPDRPDLVFDAEVQTPSTEIARRIASLDPSLRAAIPSLQV